MKWVDSGGTIALPVKLVSYDQRGHRRLGALTGGRVVDLPDAVGHPVFPTTMEALVSSSRGTVLDAARDALERDDALRFAVRGPRLLVPLVPASIRTVRAPTPTRRGAKDPMAWYGLPGYVERDASSVTGPDVPLPAAGRSVDAWLACVLGRGGRDLSPADAAGRIFGYTLMAGSSEAGAWSSLGPCVVTADELDPAGVVLATRVGGEAPVGASAREHPWSFEDLVAHLSWTHELSPGDVLASGGLRIPAARGSLLELEGSGIGVLRNRVESPAA